MTKKWLLILLWRFYSTLWFFINAKLFSIINFFKPKLYVSKINDEILLQSATSLAFKIRSGELSSEIVVNAFVDRCHEVNPLLNAIVEDNFENALRNAKEVDEQIFNGTAPSFDDAPFLGVPFSVKNCIQVEGLDCSVGMACRVNKRATEDAVVVERMKRAGAIPLAMTNVSEACMWWECVNNFHGRTNNPYDCRRSVGGSSGGEGALIAAAGSVIGLGTDAAGSIRIPCFFNGIFGHKPTANVIDVKGSHAHIRDHKNLLFVAGPMCRYAEDLAPMLGVLAGPNSALKISLKKQVDFSKLKIFYMNEISTGISSPVQKEIKETMRKALNYFSIKYNVLNFKMNLSFMHYAFPLLLNALDNPTMPKLKEIMCHCDGKLRPKIEFIKYLMGFSKHIWVVVGLAMADEFLSKIGNTDQRRRFTRIGEILRRQLNELLGDDGVFIFPPHPTLVPFHKQAIGTPLDCIYASFVNTLGLPSTSCPMGLTPNGLPLGIQIIGAANRDYLTVSVAKELSQVFGGWKEPGRPPYCNC